MDIPYHILRDAANVLRLAGYGSGTKVDRVRQVFGLDVKGFSGELELNPELIAFIKAVDEGDMLAELSKPILEP